MENINKNIFNNFLITESRRTRAHFFQKLPSPAPAPESRNAPVLHSYKLASFLLSANTVSKVLKKTTRIEYCLIILYISFNRVSIHQGQ